MAADGSRNGVTVFTDGTSPLAFTITVALDLAFIPLIWIVEKLLMKVTGLRLEY